MKERKQFELFREIIVDNFAGGGGASTGISIAIGRSVDIAINHDKDAIAMHQKNHPGTEHYCESVWDIDPVKVVAGRPVALCWFSPDCKHFSKAKGGKPVDKNIRGLAWVAIRWAATVKPRVIMLENVEEFKTWGPVIAERDPETGRLIKVIRSEDDEIDDQYIVAEQGEIVPDDQKHFYPDPKRKGVTFRAFINALKRQGYQVEYRELVASDYGAPTTRKRFFLVARNDGLPIVWPEPTHGNPKSLAVQAGRLKPWIPAANIIDWSLPCKSIFERKRPLAENTLRRIARGLFKFVIDNPEPFIIKVNHKGEMFRGQKIGEPLQTVTAKNGYGVVEPFIARIGQTGFGGDRMQYDIKDPLTTVVSKAEHLLVAPTMIQVGYGERKGQEPRTLELGKPLGTVVSGGRKHALVSAVLVGAGGPVYMAKATPVDEPMRTVVAENHRALVQAFITKFRTGATGSAIDEPLHTITSGAGSKRPAGAPHAMGLVTSHLLKMKGANIGQPATEPIQTITAGGLHFGEVRAFLIKYYGAGTGQPVSEPVHTVTSHDTFGLVVIHGDLYQIVDIGLRMLEPRELFNAQGFPANYVIDIDADGKKISKSGQVARCGNAVPPAFAEALVRANLPALCGAETRREEAR